MKLVVGVVCCLLSFFANAQIRLTTLELRPKEIYSLETSDILVLDTLIMRDSSSIMLSAEKKDFFIHSKKIVVGKGCRIIGRGESGKPGKNGAKGLTGEGPCRDGVIGKGGTGGSHGDYGKNLSVYTTELIIKGNLLVELSGGDGGDGGKGGEGGGGSPGTRVCIGGNGGSGGNGSSGGNGGDAGTLLIVCKNCINIRSWLNHSLLVRTYGGNAGLGGIGGQGGSAGLNPTGNSSQDGRQGTKGKTGPDGQAGKNGAINFQ
ncbi:MAG TPA: hypothetical protein VIT44_06290 [Cyclobacteriaceae bacterium]